MIKGSFKITKENGKEQLKISDTDFSGKIKDVLNEMINISAAFLTEIPRDFLKASEFKEEEIQEVLFYMKMALREGISDKKIRIFDIDEIDIDLNDTTEYFGDEEE